jgi:hypothetical protein
MACKGGFGDRASRICGPPNVIAAELFAGRDWQPATSPDGVPIFVAAPLAT